MKKIAYIEIDTHAEIVSNFYELTNNSEEFAVDFYLSEKILNQLQWIQNECIIKSSYELIINQLRGKSYDLIIIGTVHRYFSVFDTIVKHYKTAVLVHNQRFVKLTKTQLLLNIFKEDVIFRLKLLLKEGLLKMSEIYKKSAFRLVLDEHFSDESRLFLPTLFSKDEKFDKSKNDRLRIVIPGQVSQKRRDYSSVFQRLMNFKMQVQVVFLGRASGQELDWIKQFEKQKSENVTLKYFTEKVPQSEFDKLMNEADVLWCPIQSKNYFFSNKEIYRKTKMTGNIGDAIRYRKLAVFPVDYQCNYEFVFPENEQLEQQFINLSRDGKDYFDSYSKNLVSNKLHNILQKMIDD